MDSPTPNQTPSPAESVPSKPVKDQVVAATPPSSAPPSAPSSAQPPPPAPDGTPAPAPDSVDSSIIHPASDHFKITPGKLPQSFKKPSIFTPKGVATWYAINHRAATAAIVAGVIALGVGAGLTALVIRYSKKPVPKEAFNPQGSDNKSLEQLSTEKLDTSKPGQSLTILADSKFKNDLTVGGNTALHKLTIDGVSAMQGGANVQNYLNVAGSLSATGSLNVSGNGTFGGVLSVNTLTAKTLTATGGLTLGGHVQSGGQVPTAVTGPAAAGGSVLISGNDTAGTVTITTGTAPFAGQLATINFRTAYASTPHVVLTAVGPSAARLQYYNSKSLTFFTIESLAKPDPSTTYIFDYVVVQ